MLVHDRATLFWMGKVHGAIQCDGRELACIEPHVGFFGPKRFVFVTKFLRPDGVPGGDASADARSVQLPRHPSDLIGYVGSSELSSEVADRLRTDSMTPAIDGVCITRTARG